MFKNDDEEEPGENNNNKYIMFSNEEKDENLDIANIENENSQQNDNSLNKSDEIIPSLPYKINSEEKDKNNLNNEKENENELNNVNQNIISNDYDDAKMVIQNFYV